MKDVKIIMNEENVENTKEELKEFKIPVTWEVYGEVTVEAKDALSALKEAKRIEDETDGGFALPKESYYVDASFRIEEEIEMIETLNQFN